MKLLQRRKAIISHAPILILLILIFYMPLDLIYAQPGDSLQKPIILDDSLAVNNPARLCTGDTGFIAYDEAPVLLKGAAPIYPEKAGIDRIEGAVWIKELVDKSGNVSEAFVLKDSGLKAGFEESALAVAKARLYRPALKDGKPVAVWVSYKVAFKLK